MKLRIRSLNLYTRILLWFLLNVVVLAAAVFAVLQWQFREGFRGALGTIAADRLQVIGQQMYEKLSGQPRSQWDEVLTAIGQNHDVQATLMSPPETWVAGDRLELPREVHDRLSEMLRGERGPSRGPGGGGPPPPPPPRDPLDEFLFGSSPFEPAPHAEEARRAPPLHYGTFLVHAGEPKRYWSVVRLPPPTGWPIRTGPPILVIASRSMTGGGLFFDLRPWLIGIFGAMVLSALLWLPFVRGITGSIRAHVRATEDIAKGRFDVRVPEERGDELGRMAYAVNQMAVQLDGLVRGQKRFLGDIAHELCSPIARMEMSLALLEQQVSGKEATRLEDVRDELRQISALVNELLSFSKAALGQPGKALETVSVLPLLREVIATEAVDDAQVMLQVPAELAVSARPDLLRRAVGNVLRNARLHAPETRIEIEAVRSNGHIRLSIADHGPGVPSESLPRLFEPFYRVDLSRTRETGGVGLGLSIVKSCVESCGGTVVAENRAPHGLRITMALASA
ncbi:MAG TPA: HAMP domain-containing sensor histidine kinase [Prosthecobacter sp.]|nr:HAMP domain-containing sensor histidine kinase [Prosthecobacter sp.]